jgi:TPR repeat protein
MAGMGVVRAAALVVVAPLLLSACAHSGLAPAVACQPDPSGKLPAASSAYRDKSIDDLKSLAADGDLVAARVVGERYEHGDGVAADPKAAADWYQRAAFTPPTTMPVYMPGYGKVSGTVLSIPAPPRPGDPVAMAHLGWLYINGDALPFDEARGRELLACAATRGVNVGDMSALSGNPHSTDRKISDHG